MIQDMGMRDIFPSFSQLIDKKLADFLIDEYIVGENYRFGSYVKPEDKPTRVFKLTLKELKDIIFSTHSPSFQ